MNPKSIITRILDILTALERAEEHAWLSAERENILREIGLVKSADGKATRTGVDFGAASFAALEKKLKPADKAAAKTWVAYWRVVTAMWAYVVAVGAVDKLSEE